MTLRSRLPTSSLAVLLALLSTGPILPQTPLPPVEYEVAVIRPNNSGTGSSSTNGTRSQIVFTNQTLRRYVERAYDVRSFQLAAPDWMDTLRFDITAKNPENAKPEDSPVMLRVLLEQRFKLATHREKRDGPGYGLTVGKNGFKLTPAEATGGSTTDSSGGRIKTFRAGRISMASLAEYLAVRLGQPVVDNTGVSGVFNIELRWADDSTAATDEDSAPSLFTALQESLGLQLQRQKVTVDMIVVDHMERTPVGEN